MAIEMRDRITNKWIKTVDYRFLRDGLIYEKYNMVDPKVEPVSAVYPDQIGFGWTNAVAELFINNHHS